MKNLTATLITLIALNANAQFGASLSIENKMIKTSTNGYNISNKTETKPRLGLIYSIPYLENSLSSNFGSENDATRVQSSLKFDVSTESYLLMGANINLSKFGVGLQIALEHKGIFVEYLKTTEGISVDTKSFDNINVGYKFSF